MGDGRSVGRLVITGIATYLGGPIAGLVASIIASSLLPQKVRQQGPQLSDLKVQNASYGTTLPIVLKKARLGGRIIDQSDLKPVDTTSSSGGGSGEPEVETTTTDYYVDLMIALHDARYTEIIGITKIWANGELIYDDGMDVGDPPGSPQLTALMIRLMNPDVLQELAWSNARTIAGLMKIYPGSETQLPSEVFEALRGVGEIPAYRGTGLVTMANFQVTKWLTVPNLEFEVITMGGSVAGPRRYWTNATDQLGYSWWGWNDGFVGNTVQRGPIIHSCDGSKLTVIEHAGALTALRRIIYDVGGKLFYSRSPAAGDDRHGCGLGITIFGANVWVMTDASGTFNIYASGSISPSDGDVVFLRVTTVIGSVIVFDIINAYLSDIRRNVGGLYDGHIHADGILNVIPCVDKNTLTVVYQNTALEYKYKMMRFTNDEGGFYTSAPLEVVQSGDVEWQAFNPVLKGRGRARGQLQLAYGDLSMMESDYSHIWNIDVGEGHGNSLWWIDPEDGIMKRIGSSLLGVSKTNMRDSASIWADKGMCFVVNGRGLITCYTYLPVVTADGVTLADVVELVTTVGAGMDVSDIDVSELTDTFDGVGIA